jgi:hypothetical protein
LNSPREEVATATWVFSAVIRLTLDGLRDDETRRMEGRADFTGQEKAEIERDRVSPEFVQVQRVIADVKRHEKHAIGSQDSPELTESIVKL